MWIIPKNIDKPLSKKQSQIFEFIKSEVGSKGYPPSVREICEHVQLNSPATVHFHLKTLELKGFIRRNPQTSRSIEIIVKDQNFDSGEFVNVPIIGSVAAGAPILCAEDLLGTFPIPVHMIGNRDVFMLKTQGESMINAGIFPDDLLLIARQNTAQNGELIVANIDDSVTVKRIFKEQNFIRLRSENDLFNDILLRSVEIIGKVIGLYRQIK